MVGWAALWATAEACQENAMIAIVANVFLVWLPTDNRTLLYDYRSIAGWMHFSADDIWLEAICAQLDRTQKIKNCFLVKNRVLVLFKKNSFVAQQELLKGHSRSPVECFFKNRSEALALEVTVVSILLRRKGLDPIHFPVTASRFFISSFRSCPTQLWIRGTIVLGGNYGQYYSA
jgi:hypothetical protein